MKTNKTSQFPNIFRFIPDSKIFKKIIKSEKTLNFFIGLSTALCILIVLGILIIMLSLYKNINKAFYLVNLRQNMLVKTNFWKSIANKYDGYKDAYFQQAVLEYSLGNYSLAKEANSKCLLLDPNFNNAKKLEMLLKNK